MPTLAFDPANKTETVSDFPRLKLDHMEKGRILCLEDPAFAYVHELRAPKIVNGRAETKTFERKDGSTYTDFIMDFIGRPLCLGDLGVLMDKGVDPRNCPACRRATEGDEIQPPKRRFAMHVIKYAVKTNSFDLIQPFSCQLVVWGFTNMTYNKLTDIVSEYGNLREHDLLLGPCTNKDFQKFEIMPASKAAWMLDDQIKNTVLGTYQQNKLPDLDSFCGRKVERRWFEDDIAKVAERWRIANGAPSPDPGTESADERSLTEGLNDLLNTTPPAVDLGDLLSAKPAGDDTTPEPSTEPAAKGGTMDFDELLKSL